MTKTGMNVIAIICVQIYQTFWGVSETHAPHVFLVVSEVVLNPSSGKSWVHSQAQCRIVLAVLHARTDS